MTPERIPLPPAQIAQVEQVAQGEQMRYPHVYGGWERAEIYKKTIAGNEYMLLTSDFNAIYNPLNRGGEIPRPYAGNYNLLMDEFIGCYIQSVFPGNFELKEDIGELPVLDHLNANILDIKENVLSNQSEGILNYNGAIGLFNHISGIYKTSLQVLYQAELDKKRAASKPKKKSKKSKKSKK